MAWMRAVAAAAAKAACVGNCPEGGGAFGFCNKVEFSCMVFVSVCFNAKAEVNYSVLLMN